MLSRDSEPTIEATKVQAIALELKDGGGQAILVQEGPEWNNLCKFKCIAPASCEGGAIIATRRHEGTPFDSIFGAIFKLGQDETWVVVLVTPDLGTRIARQ